MKNKVISVIVVVIVVFIGVVVMNGRDTAEAGAVKIGIALPLSGPAAMLGEAARNAALMAIEDAGVTKHQYELVIEDDAFEPTKTATVANKFISIDQVLAMITFGSGTSNAASPITDEAKVAHFSLASDPTSAEGEFNFIHWTPAFVEGELLASEMVARGYKTVSIIDANHPGMIAVTDAIKASLAGTGVEVLSYDVTNVGEKDFRTVAQEIKTANPDVIVVQLFSPEVELATKQLRELGVTGVITGAESFEWSGEPELFEGVWFVSDATVDSFADRYKARFGTDAKPGSAYVYDLVRLIVSEHERSTKALDQQVFAEQIAEMDVYESATFGSVPITEDGLFVTKASVKKIEGGKVVSEK
jgi:branched-chain amino acid transport system substrate-binding protein